MSWNLVSEEDLKEGEGVFHTVKKGDTLGGIARLYGADIQDIAEENDVYNTRELKPGEKLFIPGAAKGTVAAKDAEPADQEIKETKKSGKSQKEKSAKKTREEKTAMRTDEKPAMFKGKFIWPVKGVVSSRFGVRGGRKHQGIDVAAPKGTPVVAVAPGKVLYSDNKLKGYGNLVLISHADGFLTVYAHNSENIVREGDTVKQGQKIALVGSTGNSEAPHLHFEIREGAKARNPMFFLP